MSSTFYKFVGHDGVLLDRFEHIVSVVEAVLIAVSLNERLAVLATTIPPMKAKQSAVRLTLDDVDKISALVEIFILQSIIGYDIELREEELCFLRMLRLLWLRCGGKLSSDKLKAKALTILCLILLFRCEEDNSVVFYFECYFFLLVLYHLRHFRRRFSSLYNDSVSCAVKSYLFTKRLKYPSMIEYSFHSTSVLADV